MSVQLTRQTVTEECMDLELTPDQQGQFDKLESVQDKAAYLDALLGDDSVTVSSISSTSTDGYKDLAEDNGKPQPCAEQDYLDYLDKNRKQATPINEYKVRFGEVMEDSNIEMVTEKVNATSYQEAVESVFKGAIADGRTIDRLFPGAGETPPVLIQLDRNIFDLTASADNDTVLKVGAMEVNINRNNHNLSVTMTNALNGDEVDAMSISDQDYLQALDDGMKQNSGPSLG
jgi:hypothetical protein